MVEATQVEDSKQPPVEELSAEAQSTQELVDCLAQLGDHQHLRREKALTKVTGLLGGESGDQTVLVVAVAFFKQMLTSARWEDRFGAINGILAIIQTREGPSALADTFLWEHILVRAYPALLVDPEFRVRN